MKFFKTLVTVYGKYFADKLPTGRDSGDKSAYDTLQANYARLEKSFNQLDSCYQEVSRDYGTLQQTYTSTVSELENLRKLYDSLSNSYKLKVEECTTLDDRCKEIAKEQVQARKENAKLRTRIVEVVTALSRKNKANIILFASMLVVTVINFITYLKLIAGL
jgi:chromosome segregation ATPase